jgi:hypothetical protein
MGFWERIFVEKKRENPKLKIIERFLWFDFFIIIESFKNHL